MGIRYVSKLGFLREKRVDRKYLRFSKSNTRNPFTNTHYLFEAQASWTRRAEFVAPYFAKWITQRKRCWIWYAREKSVRNRTYKIWEIAWLAFSRKHLRFSRNNLKLRGIWNLFAELRLLGFSPCLLKQERRNTYRVSRSPLWKVISKHFTWVLSLHYMWIVMKGTVTL